MEWMNEWESQANAVVAYKMGSENSPDEETRMLAGRLITLIPLARAAITARDVLLREQPNGAHDIYQNLDDAITRAQRGNVR